MFSEVEKIMAEFKPIAIDFKAKSDKYHDLEDNQYNTEDEIEDFKAELEKEYTAKISKAEKKDDHKCKCCNSVLSSHVVNAAELATMEKDMWDKIDNHPKVKRLEKRRDKEVAAFKALDKEIDKLADTIYEYESEIRKALEAIELPNSWFNFHTSLV